MTRRARAKSCARMESTLNRIFPLAGRIGEAFGGCLRRGIALQEAVGVSQFQDTVDHAGAACEAKRTAGRLEPGEAVDDLAHAAAVEFGEAGKVKDHTPVVLAQKIIKSQLKLLTLHAHLQRAAQLEGNDPRF